MRKKSSYDRTEPCQNVRKYSRRNDIRPTQACYVTFPRHRWTDVVTSSSATVEFLAIRALRQNVATQNRAATSCCGACAEELPFPCRGCRRRKDARSTRTKSASCQTSVCVGWTSAALRSNRHDSKRSDVFGGFASQVTLRMVTLLTSRRNRVQPLPCLFHHLQSAALHHNNVRPRHHPSHLQLTCLHLQSAHRHLQFAHLHLQSAHLLPQSARFRQKPPRCT